MRNTTLTMQQLSLVKSRLYEQLIALPQKIDVEGFSTGGFCEIDCYRCPSRDFSPCFAPQQQAQQALLTGCTVRRVVSPAAQKATVPRSDCQVLCFFSPCSICAGGVHDFLIIANSQRLASANISLC